jgi:tetratricopeptide (TPR) repeat protein
MDKALIGDQAMTAFRRALDAEPGHRDAFLRLRILLEEDANHDELAILLGNRLDVEPDGFARVELHRALAELNRNFLSDRDTAKHHFRQILEAEPNDLHAYGAIADIAWEQGNWQEAADALMARARLERSPEVLKQLCFRLGTLYADRLNDVPMALRAFQRALTYQPDDVNTLVRLAELATVVGEWKLALSACERLVKNETDPDLRATHLHRVARIFKQGFGDLKRAERALNLALDGAPTNDEALGQLVQFYRDANDITSVRVHLNRVAGAMRARVTHDPQDGIAYRVIARTMAARANAGVPGSLPIARAAAELADLLGASGEPEQKLLQTSRQPDLSLITKAESDEVIFPRGVPVELRHIFQLLGDRIAKHVGVDLRPYGVTRGDRLRARDNPVAAVAQSVATGLGFAEIDVYISNRQPWVMVAEPTSPVSLVIGSAIAAAGGDTIRFAAGAALKLAQSSLAIPARLANDDLGVLILALLRLFQPDFPIIAINAEAVAAQAQKLRRLIPTGLMNELKPFALGVDAQSFNHTDLARDLRVAGLRAGLVASGSLVAGLRILAAQLEAELPGFLADPLAQGLIAFALGEDHAVVAR